MGKRLYFLLFAIVFTATNFISKSSSAQVVRLYTGFDNYIGSAATAPSGWYISWNSTSSPSYYFTLGNYGASAPSYKFGVTQDTIVSPHFLSGDTIRFWCKGQAPFSAQNVLGIFISEDSISWNQIQNIDSLPVTSSLFSFPLPCSAHYVMFIYFKVNGNLAFDDVKVTMTNYFPVASFVTTLNSICVSDSACFIDMSSLTGCDTITSRIWNFGDGSPLDSSQNPCHVYSQPGNYSVWLRVTASNGNIDSTNLNITIYPLPTVQFSAIGTSGTSVNFTDLSTISSGNISSWYWDFGDLNFSAQQNPQHFYFSAGMYYVCLTATSNNGCVNTYCDSVNVIDVGIEENDFSSEISISPNPVMNELSVIGYMLSEKSSFEIYNVLGQSVFSQHAAINSQQKFVIDVSQLNPGIYFLKIKFEPKSLSVKFIIDK